MPTIAYVNAKLDRAANGGWTVDVDYGLKVRPWEAGRWIRETVTVGKDGRKLAGKVTEPPTQLPGGVTPEAEDDDGDYYLVARSLELVSVDDPRGARVTVDVAEAPLAPHSCGTDL